MKKFLSGQIKNFVDAGLLTDLLKTACISLQEAWHKTPQLEGLAKFDKTTVPQNRLGFAIEVATIRILSQFFTDVAPKYFQGFTFENGEKNEGKEINTSLLRSNFCSQFETYFQTNYEDEFSQMRAFVQQKITKETIS